ncbi:aminotransferase class I/II-fold pyridoxal phosphate-dependent enzyme [Actinomadura sp. 6K520]|jgi:CAI-1 autoinducer synthase|uniref:aminotransferase class I/II-fold pyridoxal phosphate-dependent enzyme n=1 Tax=Actinomadura sp. 6K520 TaxID=2530364 RepID=UPI00104B2B9C|nr:aminotransferase class I/II-fold pyridoxal phosphate-dependent enzyme [Actinomadura sp. 6K520]TDE27310.1 aminotransferase class I/II-fold pyridoxal phosphate-dependent enzyme [Actinomadura sp. 6K520]
MTSAHQRLGERISRFRGTWSGRRPSTATVPGSRAIVLTCSDYLDLAEHPAIADAMIASLRTAEGAAAPVPAPCLPDDHPQIVLGAEFARHLGARAGVLCSSGWTANTGLMQVVAGPDVPVYLDALAHMSLWEGARAAGAELACFRHNDLGHLRRRVEVGGSGVIAVDAVYSTDGSVCPLPGLVEIAEAHDCLLVVDESHSLGTRGARGEGLVAALGLTGRVDFRTASLAKALPGRAGLIACDRPGFADYFTHTALPAVFSSTLLPHDVAGLSAALRVVRDERRRRDRLRAVTRRLRDGLAGLGYRLVESDTQIIALETGSEADATLMRDALAARDIFSAALFPPTASVGRTLVRLSAHAGLADNDVKRILGACRALRPRLGEQATASAG